MDKKGKLIVVSAPSGTGKTTIVKSILSQFDNLVFSVSATTRKKRENEINGVDYFFISEEDFHKKVDNEEFAEWERFYDYCYGTLKYYINENINKGFNVLLELDVKGALTIKQNYPDSVLLYIAPPSFEELVNRLIKRNTESEDELVKRIDRAKMELGVKDKFDYVIVNNKLDEAIKETKELIERITKE